MKDLLNQLIQELEALEKSYLDEFRKENESSLDARSVRANYLNGRWVGAKSSLLLAQEYVLKLELNSEPKPVAKKATAKKKATIIGSDKELQLQRLSKAEEVTRARNLS